MIYFAQIVIPRLRKISPNCAQIVLEKKKHHKIFTRKIEILLENHGIFEKKKKTVGKQKNQSGKTPHFSNKIFIAKKLVFKPTQHQAHTTNSTQIP